MTNHHELDATVAEIEGVDVFYSEIHDVHFRVDRYDSGTAWQEDAVWSPTSRWEQAGPIIERERIAVFRLPRDEWGAMVILDSYWREYGSFDSTMCDAWGPTPLVAAMRAFVAARGKP